MLSRWSNNRVRIPTQIYPLRRADILICPSGGASAANAAAPTKGGGEKMAKWVKKFFGYAEFSVVLEDYRDQAQWMNPLELAEEILDDSRLSNGQKVRVIETLGL